MLTVFLKILFAFLLIGGMGIFLGFGLAAAARKFKVEKDKMLIDLESALPGLNCGACGYAGCSSYAEALASGEDTDLEKCKPGGQDVILNMATLLGQDVSTEGREKMVAQVHCRGLSLSPDEEFNYQGLRDCNALYQMYQGNMACKYGCLGMGSCMDICPVNAIYRDSQGCIWVDKNRCIGCEKCVHICPTGVLKMIPWSADYIVACNSKDKGKDTRKICKVGCIACRICVKKSPEAGYVVEENLCHIDYSETGNRVPGAEACPAHCIIPVKEEKKNIPAEKEEKET